MRSKEECKQFLWDCNLPTHTSYLQIATKVTAQETLQMVASTYIDPQSLVHSSQVTFPKWKNEPLDLLTKLHYRADSDRQGRGMGRGMGRMQR